MYKYDYYRQASFKLPCTKGLLLFIVITGVHIYIISFIFSHFRYNHFLPNSQSEGIRASHDGDVVSMFALLCKVLGNSSTPQDSRFVICSIIVIVASFLYLKCRLTCFNVFCFM